ncbi:MAG: peptidoglycan-binding protein [Immundisolibacterales bacterium]|nr:peptidoglycan-binding protein [Immundisolibacterales bacterium]
MRIIALSAAVAMIAGLSAGPTAAAAEARIETFVFGCETPDGRILKPKFGDIEGAVYPDLPAQRERCLSAIGRRVALCRENTDFSVGTNSEDLARCLTLFREQAQACVRHFTLERSKCAAGSGEPGEAARLDATGWRRVQQALLEDGFDPGPVDGILGPKTRGAVQAWQQANGFPATGALTRAQARALVGGAVPIEPFGPNWSFVENQPCQVHNPHPRRGELITWSGGCVDGRTSGSGRLVWRGDYGEHVYEGGYREGKRNGLGTYTWADGDRYEGEYRDGKEDGHGIWTAAGGDRYEGEWRAGFQNGRGTYSWVNGDRYEGQWRAGRPHGHGIWTGAGGDRYEGEMGDGTRHGYGTYNWAGGDRYEGEFRDGAEHGRGTWTGAEGGHYAGEWRDGIPHVE